MELVPSIVTVKSLPVAVVLNAVMDTCGMGVSPFGCDQEGVKYRLRDHIPVLTGGWRQSQRKRALYANLDIAERRDSTLHVQANALMWLKIGGNRAGSAWLSIYKRAAKLT